MKLALVQTAPETGYALLDSGDGEKLERYGQYVLARPDPQAIWRKHLPQEDWYKAHLTFVREVEQGKWRKREGVPTEWTTTLGGSQFLIKPTVFKHTGVFPEQVENWQWMAERIRSAKRPVTILNLFGYTGGATLACLSAGAEVVHCDGSKTAIEWAKKNAALSGVADKPVRWILDDARAFVKREIKRGKTYDGIVMDPPAFGHGAKKEVWKIEEDLLELVENCQKLLTSQPLFFLLNGYSAGYSAIAYGQMLTPLVERYGGQIEQGELAILEEGSQRSLPSGIFARWSI